MTFQIIHVLIGKLVILIKG